MSEENEIIKPQKTKKDYNKTYYEKNRRKIINSACEKIQCDKCDKFITRKGIQCHQKTKLCKKLQLENKFEQFMKLEENRI